MMKRITFLFFILAFMHSHTAIAQEDHPLNSQETSTVPPQDENVAVSSKDEYAKANWTNLLHTLVRLRSLDLQDPVLLDEYAILSECKLYQMFYADDFKWNKVRIAVGEDAKPNLATYPVTYHFDTKLQLDRYDFQRGIFRFSPKATLSNINTVVLYEVQGLACGSADIKHLPKKFRVVFDSLINIGGLPLSPKDAEVVLKQMEDDHNTNRVVYTRLKFKIVYAEPWKKVYQGNASASAQYNQGSKTSTTEMRLDARLDAIDFYEDEAMTKLIYQYKG